MLLSRLNSRLTCRCEDGHESAQSSTRTLMNTNILPLGAQSIDSLDEQRVFLFLPMRSGICGLSL